MCAFITKSGDCQVLKMTQNMVDSLKREQYIMNPSVCSFGEAEDAPRQVIGALKEMGLRFSSDTPSEVRDGNELEQLFQTYVEQKDIVFLVHDAEFSASELGQRFLKLMSLLHVTRDDKPIVLIKTDKSSAPLDLERLPTVDMCRTDTWRGDLKEVVDSLR